MRASSELLFTWTWVGDKCVCLCCVCVCVCVCVFTSSLCLAGNSHDQVFLLPWQPWETTGQVELDRSVSLFLSRWFFLPVLFIYLFIYLFVFFRGEFFTLTLRRLSSATRGWFNDFKRGRHLFFFFFFYILRVKVICSIIIRLISLRRWDFLRREQSSQFLQRQVGVMDLHRPSIRPDVSCCPSSTPAGVFDLRATADCFPLNPDICGFFHVMKWRVSARQICERSGRQWRQSAPSASGVPDV